MELDRAVEFARGVRQSVLVTVRRDTRPQLSNVLHTVHAGGVVRVSVTEQRAKFKNLTRVPWAALHVTSADFFAYAVLEGTAELSRVAASPDDPTVDELVDMYRTISGEHPDWHEYRRAMVSDRRAVVRLRPERAYGRLP